MYDAAFWGNLIDQILDFLSSFSTDIWNFLGTISWPILILIIVLVFRKQIEILILHIKKGKLFGFEFEIGDIILAYSRDDQKIYSIPLEKPIEKKLDDKVKMASEKEIAESKQKAEKRLEEDFNQTGIKRGRLFQHSNGKWGIVWEVFASTSIGVKSDIK